MDVPRTVRRSRRRPIIAGVAALGIVLLVVVTSRLQPAAPPVDRLTVVLDTVTLGPMVREVRAAGTLVPEQVRWISAIAPGRVERKLVQPGARVTAGTVLMELVNPDVEIQLLQAERQLTDAQAQLVSLRTSLESARLTQAGVVATTRAQYLEAKRLAAANNELVRQRMVSEFEAARSREVADELTERLAVEQERLRLATENLPAQLRVQEEQVKRLEAIVAFQRSLAAALTVRAGADGVLQELPLEIGQFAQSGTTIAKVVQPERLKAVLRVQETQARDVTIGQAVAVDTRNGVVRGQVVRIDPASVNGMVTVDVALPDSLPRGARPDLTVDGTIELERLDRVLHMGRPTFGQANGAVGLFRVSPDGREAVRVMVKLGRSSADAVEIREGLAPGDVVILSDMSRHDTADRVTLK